MRLEFNEYLTYEDREYLHNLLTKTEKKYKDGLITESEYDSLVNDIKKDLDRGYKESWIDR